MGKRQAEPHNNDLYSLIENARQRTVNLAYKDISILESVSIRGKLNPSVVRQYCKAYEAGREMPPLMVLREEGGADILVDGYHRYHALMEYGRAYAPIACHLIEEAANSTRSTIETARYLQYYLNSSNGLRLNQREVKEGWRRYFAAKMYRLPGKQVKSLREIGREFGVAHTTVRNFISRNFKNIAKFWKKEYKWIDRDCNNPEGCNGFLRTDKSKTAYNEILLDIRKIEGKSQLVKPGSREYEEMCEAVLCLYDVLKPEGTPQERLSAGCFLQAPSCSNLDF